MVIAYEHAYYTFVFLSTYISHTGKYTTALEKHGLKTGFSYLLHSRDLLFLIVFCAVWRL